MKRSFVPKPQGSPATLGGTPGSQLEKAKRENASLSYRVRTLSDTVAKLSASAVVRR